MVKNGNVNDKAILDFLKKTTFAQEDDPANLKLWPSLVIGAFDRNIPDFDRPTCEAIYTRLAARGETPEKYLLHECMVSMQFPVHQSELDDRDARLARLEARFGNDHLSIPQLKTSLAAHTD